IVRGGELAERSGRDTEDLDRRVEIAVLQLRPRVAEALFERLVVTLLDAVCAQDGLGHRARAATGRPDRDALSLQVLDGLETAGLEGDDLGGLGVELPEPARVVDGQP